MLCLKVADLEHVWIGEDVAIILLRDSRGSVRLGIHAPAEMKIKRGTLPDAKPFPGRLDSELRRAKRRPKSIKAAMLAFFCVLGLAAAAWADAPTASITVGSTGEDSSAFLPGDLIVASAGPVVAPPGDNGPVPPAGTQMRWFIEPERFPDGRLTWMAAGPGQVIVASRPGRYRLELIVANPDGIARAVREVVVTGTTPGPTPPGPSPPAPDPGPPEDRFGFMGLIRSESAAVPAANRPFATRISTNFRLAAVAAEVGVKTGNKAVTVESVNSMLAALNGTFSPADKAPWANVMKAVSQRLNQVAQDLPATAEALGAVATAFEAVAK